MGGGVGLLDYDGDGWLDVYAVQGGPFPPPRAVVRSATASSATAATARFEDVTATSGLAAFPGGYGHGVAVGDYDNDGRPDLFVTRWRSYALYHNRGGGRFEDVTDRAGLGGDRDWPTSAAFADLDNDGDLDLYVCHYLDWDADATRRSAARSGRPESVHGYCDPRDFPRVPDHVFRNDGGRFVDVTAEAGIVDRDGRGLGVVAADLDGDGRIDLFVANDTSANFFFRNRGGFRFEETRRGVGPGGQRGGRLPGGHGGRLRRPRRRRPARPGRHQLLRRVDHALPQPRGRACSATGRPPPDSPAPTRTVLGFGLSALDANNDGRLDLVQANGHVNDYRPSLPYAMPAQLFLGVVPAAGSSTSRTGPALRGAVPRPGAGWPSATSTTTAGSTSCSSPSRSRSPSSATSRTPSPATS